MLPFFLYLIRVSLSIALVYVLYRWAIQQLPRLAWNRAILLGGLAISFSLPLTQYSITFEVPSQFSHLLPAEPEPISEAIPPTVSPSDSATGPVIAETPAASADSFAWGNVLLVIYLLGVGVKAGFWMMGQRKVYLLRKKSMAERHEGFWLHYLPVTFSPCSHFQHVFVGEKFEQRDQAAKQAILAHEGAHVKLGHSWDMWLMDMAHIALWFHPLLGQYRKALQEVHEYQADAKATQAQSRTEYARLLVSLSQAQQDSQLGHGFARSLLKARIFRLFSAPNRPLWHYGSLGLLIPFLILTSCTQWEEGAKVVKADSVALAPVLPPPPPPVPDSTRFIPCIRPVEGNIFSGFGPRTHPILKTRRMHTGVDFIAEMGTPVIATADGIVHVTGVNRGGYGIQVVIEHGDEYQTRYAHLSEVLVEKGQEVKRGDVIAYSGNTGLSTKPHLHYEIMELKAIHDSIPAKVNPKLFMPTTNKDQLFGEPSSD